MNRAIRLRYVFLLTLLDESRKPLSTNDPGLDFTEEDVKLFAEMCRADLVDGNAISDATGEVVQVFDMTITYDGREKLSHLKGWKGRVFASRIPLYALIISILGALLVAAKYVADYLHSSPK